MNHDPAIGDLVYDTQRRLEGVVDKIDSKGMAWYEEHTLNAAPVLKPPRHITHISNLIRLARSEDATSTITQRMIRDLIAHAPSFRLEGSDLFWADADGTTYAVTMLIPGLSEEQSEGLDSSTVGV